MSNASFTGYTNIPGFETGNTMIHAGYNFLDLIRISNQLDIFLSTFILSFSKLSIELTRDNIICMLTLVVVLDFIFKSVPKDTMKIDKENIKNDIKDKLITIKKLTIKIG